MALVARPAKPDLEGGNRCVSWLVQGGNHPYYLLREIHGYDLDNHHYRRCAPHDGNSHDHFLRRGHDLWRVQGQKGQELKQFPLKSIAYA
jgi:hypothetical protein